MRTAHVPRHNSSMKQKVAGPGRKKSSPKEDPPKEDKMADVEESAGKFFAFTIDASTGQIVRLESLDAAGARHELSEEEKASLAQTGGAGKLEEVLEQAFEAGIACVLGEADGQEGTQEAESAEDAKLRHLLLAPLMEHSAAGHLLQREVLNRAILATLIERSTKPLTAPAGGPAAGERGEPARAH